MLAFVPHPRCGTDRGPSPYLTGDPVDRAAWLKLCNLQRRILPQQAPAVAGWRLHMKYRPAFVVTGDYHDFFDRPDGRAAAFVGDGSGHGPAASMLMAKMRVLLHTHDLHRTPGQTLSAANRLFHRLVPSDLFMTGLYLLFEPGGWVSWAAAGHHQPIVVHRTGAVRLIDTTLTGTALGFDPAAFYPTVRVRLEPGDRLLAFTDGLYEARNPAREQYTPHRVWQFVRYMLDDTLSATVDGLVGAVTAHLGAGEFDDDFTVLGVERDDAPGPITQTEEGPMTDAVPTLVVAEEPHPGVRVVRFVRPEYPAAYLDPECPDIRDTPLYKEVHRAALADLPPGGAVVLNLGMMDALNSAFFRLLGEVNNDVGKRMLVCCLTAFARQNWDVFSGDKRFPGQTRGSEGKAVYDAKQPA